MNPRILKQAETFALQRFSAGEKIQWTPEEEGLIAELSDRMKYKWETGELPRRDPGDPQGMTDALQEYIQHRNEREYFDGGEPVEGRYDDYNHFDNWADQESK